MDKRKTKVYTYTRVSTAMQIDGYSLDAQKSRMKAFAEYNDYEIVREYEDAGKSGKSIEGRVQFSQMMDDIKEGKDGVSYVLVFKLSRFGSPVIYFDEPTSGLDYDSMVRVSKLIEQLSSSGVIVFVVSHDFEFIVRTCTEVVQLDDDGAIQNQRLSPEILKTLSEKYFN